MFLRSHTVRNKNGTSRTYLRLVESRRVNGKVRQDVIATLGRLDSLQASGDLDKLVASLAGYSQHQWVKAEGLSLIGQWSREYGPVLVFRRLWEKLGLHTVFQEVYQRSPVQFAAEEAVFGMVLNRLLDPDSKLGTYEWLKETVYHPPFETLELHHLYRALDFLDEHKEIVEVALFMRGRDLFRLEVDLVFFDTTSTYFEGQGPEGLGERGYSRDKRPDLNQVMIGLVMTREGIPIAHHVFPGNTADISLFRQAVEDLKERFAVRQVVIVADRGVVSEALLRALDEEGMGYIVGIPLRKWKAAREVLRRPGRYHDVADNLRVKQVEEEGQRYVVCHNPEREAEDRRRRAEIVASLEGKLQARGLAGLAKDKGNRRYIKVKEAGEAEIDWEKVKQDEPLDGKFVLRSNTELSTEEVALAYKELWKVEGAFRDLKSGLEIRPVRHWTPSRVRGHIMVCFLGLYLQSMMSKLLREKRAGASYTEVLKDLKQVKAVRVELDDSVFLLRTELPGRAYDAFQAVGLRPPPNLEALGTSS